MIYRAQAYFQYVSSALSYKFLWRASRSCYHRFSRCVVKPMKNIGFWHLKGSQNRASFGPSGGVLWGPPGGVLWGLSWPSGGVLWGLSGIFSVASLGLPWAQAR